MPINSSIVRITDHAVDRYEAIAVAGARRHDDDARSEIRELVRSGTPTAAPSWLPTGERAADDTRRYLVFGQQRALVLDTQTSVDGRTAIVVLTVIRCPRADVGHDRGSR